TPPALSLLTAAINSSHSRIARDRGSLGTRAIAGMQGIPFLPSSIRPHPNALPSRQRRPETQVSIHSLYADRPRDHSPSDLGQRDLRCSRCARGKSSSASTSRAKHHGIPAGDREQSQNRNASSLPVVVRDPFWRSLDLDGCNYGTACE